MLITDISVRRPAFAIVVSLLLIAFGALAFQTLQLRQYPNIDTPVISITTDYRGASRKSWKPRSRSRWRGAFPASRA